MNRSYSSNKDKKKAFNENPQPATRNAKKNKPRSPFLTLSQAMIEHSNCFEENRVSLVQKFVREIDLLPKRFEKIETLYLSSNNLKSLDGIQQFYRLKNLSLANNEIDDGASLYILEQIPSIEVLTLAGNPVCRLPNYRSLVISLLPCLKSLDGKNVSQDEKNRSEVNLRTQSGLLDLLLSNYCELIKLNNLHKKLDVHRELAASHRSFVSNHVPFDVSKWKRLFDFERQLDERSKKALKSNLLQDVNTIKGELGLRDDEDDVAFSELILRQQQKIGELVYKAEEKARSLTINFRELPKEPASLRSPKSLLSPGSSSNLKNSRIGSPNGASSRSRSNKQVTIADPLPASLSTTLPKSTKASTNPRRNASASDGFGSEVFQNVQSPTSALIKSTSPGSPAYSLKNPTPHAMLNRKEIITFPSNNPTSPTYLPADRNRSPSYHNSPLKSVMTEASKLVTSPHKDECCRSLHRRISRGDFDDTGSAPQSHRSPFNKKLEERDKLIDNLAKDLRVKNQELVKYEGITKHLTDKLRNYQSLNVDSMKEAREEIEGVVRELEQSVEIQTELEQSVRNLQDELDDLQQKNYDLERQTKRLQHVEEMANSYAKELQHFTIEESKITTADVFRERNLKARTFKMLRRATTVQRGVSGFIDQYTAKKEKKLIRRIFASWGRCTVISQLNKERTFHRALRQKEAIFAFWKNETVLAKNAKMFKEELQEKALRKGMLMWKQFLDAQSKRKLIYERADAYFENRTKKRVFKKFTEIQKRQRYEPNEEKIVLKKAQKYQSFLVRKRLFNGWRNWTVKHAKPVRLNKEKASAQKSFNLLKLGFQIWTKYMKVNKQVLQKAQIKINRKNRTIRAKFFGLWRLFLNKHVPAQRIQEQKVENFTKKRLFNIWVGQLRAKQDFNERLERATEKRDSTLVKQVFKHLAKLRLKTKQLHFFSNVIKTKRASAQSSKFFSKWSKLFKGIQEDRRNTKEARREALNVHFQAWKKFKSNAVIEKIKMSHADKFLERSQKNLYVSIVQGWAKYTKLQKRNQSVLEVFSSRNKLKIYRGVLFELVKHARQSLRHNLNKLAAKSAIMAATERDNAAYVDDLDAEKVELREKAADYQDEILKLNFSLEEKDRELINMRRVLQQCEKNEKNLVEEVNLKATIVKELEVKLSRGTSDTNYVYGEYEKEIELLKEERANLLRKVGALESELQFKQRNLVDAEKVLVKQTKDADGVVKEVEKKLVSSVKMASEFRNHIEIKDDEIASLTEQLQKALKEKHELQGELAAAVVTVKESKEFYEGRMKYLESQNLDLVSNVEYMKQDLSKQKTHISDLKDDLRKSTYKLDVMKDQVHQEDKKFAESLRQESLSPDPRERLRSPSRSFHSPSHSYKRDLLTEKEEFRAVKQSIDHKINVLENYITSQGSPLRSPTVALARVQPRNKGLNSTHKSRDNPLATSMRSLRTESTRFNDSAEFDVPVREVSKPSVFMKSNNFVSPSISDKSPLEGFELSMKHLGGRDKSPLSTRSHVSEKGQKSILKGSTFSVKEAELDRMKQERIQRREGLEKRLEFLTQSLKNDIEKAKARVMD